MAQIQSATQPGPANVGDTWYNPTTRNTLTWDGGAWKGRRVVLTMNQAAFTAATFAVSGPIFTAPNNSNQYVVEAVSERHGTGSTSGTLQVEVAATTVATGSGTNQLSGTIDISTTPTSDVTQNGAVTVQTPIAAGSSVNLVFGGNISSLAKCGITVVLREIN